MLKVFNDSLNKSWNAVSTKGMSVPDLKSISLFVWDKIFLWPRALLFNVPSIFRNIRQIKMTYDLLFPEAVKIQKTFSSVFTVPIFNTETTRLLIEKLNEVEAHVHAISFVEVFEYLKDKGIKFQKLAVFMHEVLKASDEKGSDVDVLEEASSTIKLLAILIEDLSSREGFLSAGKKRESPQAASPPPLKPSRDSSSGSLDAALGAVAKAVVSSSPTQSKIVWVKSLKKETETFEASKESIFIDDPLDDDLLRTIVKIQNKYSFSFKNAVVNFFRFIFIDLLIGIPKFFLIELPEMLINFQRRLQFIVDHLDQIGRSFLSLRNDILALLKLIESFKFLEPFFHGLFLFLKEHDLKDSQAVLSKLDASFDKICAQMGEADLETMQTIVVDLKSLLKRVKPMLENVLEAIDGRSLAAVFTPNPLGRMFRKSRVSAGREEEVAAPLRVSFSEEGKEGIPAVARGSPKVATTSDVSRLGAEVNQTLTRAPQSVTEIFGAIKTAFSAPRL